MGQLVCNDCMMKIPSELHGIAHRITLGHEIHELTEPTPEATQ